MLLLKNLSFRLMVVLVLMCAMAEGIAQDKKGGPKGGGGDGGGNSGTGSWRTVAVSSQRGLVTSINSNGQMAGSLENSSGLTEPFAWTLGASDSVMTTPLDFAYV